MSDNEIPDHVWAATDRAGLPLSPGTCLLLARLHALSPSAGERARETLDGIEVDPPCCTHSEQVLAEDLRCSRRTIRGRFTDLSESGWVRRAKRVVGGRRVPVWILAESDRFAHTDAPEAGSCHAAGSRRKGGNPPAQGIHRHTHGEILPDGRISPCSGKDLAAKAAGSCRKGGEILPPVKGNFEQPSSPSSSPSSDPVQGSVLSLGRARTEQAIAALTVEHNVGLGLVPGPTALSPAVERVEAGDATLDDIATICAEYSRRKAAGDPAQGHWRALFYAGSWPRTAREYLRRSTPAAAAPKTRGSRRPSSALSDADDYWRAKGREALLAGSVAPGDAEADAEIDAMAAVLVGGECEF